MNSIIKIVHKSFLIILILLVNIGSCYSQKCPRASISAGIIEFDICLMQKMDIIEELDLTGQGLFQIWNIKTILILESGSKNMDLLFMKPLWGQLNHFTSINIPSLKLLC